MTQREFLTAYGYMIGLILKGVEFAVAHEQTVCHFDLSDVYSRKLIARYDLDQTNPKED
jgi:hypothetical protein